ncbi:hypothetical protein YW3DRAFT_07096 [Streptomyces sp. MnatMP-M77]|nr:hypothetical protein YW3DRAFT_07096 [Streptomyces sp. MnatMP-M77]
MVRRFCTFLHGRRGRTQRARKSLFHHAVGWLRSNRVLLPGVSMLGTHVADVRKAADKRLHATVAGDVRRGDGG